ncbi:hypothetical protein DMN91_012857 [Ooceraea biroi]|uniref:CHK kinase-like domain-containing protein n=1 Tax=Ooceraea biroi TaxID=2015173 RepID=A0A026WZ56_OOCBI|nr:uncharacterized protein LOC105286618 [Ooceraea biroi]EZA61317.1 hypothetical protein X777_12024 [Ooceraea biroi]RLU14970.1 hypothetical protein DMN91_012857 [Ooceraea biroi]
MAAESDAINGSAQDTAERFQQYLRKYEKDDKLVILQAESMPGSKLGDNYTSVLIRTKLSGRRGDGSPYTGTFMTKKLTQRPAASFLNLFDLFRMEAHVYKNILPHLGSFGPQCIFADKETIIMEDLGKKGYVYRDRRDFLDFKHTACALKKLAQLHASAFTVKIKNSQMFHEMVRSLEEIIYNDANSRMRDTTEVCITAIINQLKMVDPRTPEQQNVLDHISNYASKSYDTLSKLFNKPKETYDTICHGDPWNNNLLFLHDNNGNIIDLKMVDYQICRYTSVSTDILYLIYTSTHSSVIEKDYESLIKIYHDELIQVLRRNYINEKILADLGMHWLQAELKKHAFYGMLTGCTLAHPMLANEDDAQQFENMSWDDKDKTSDLISVITENVNKEKLDRISFVTLDYYRRYISDKPIKQ